MQRQQLLSSVIKLLYCPKTKVIATYGGFSEGANGNIKEKTNKRDHFQNTAEFRVGFGGDTAVIFDPPPPRHSLGITNALPPEKQTNKKTKKRPWGHH